MEILKGKNPQSRREFLRSGLYGFGVTVALPLFWNQASQSMAADALARGDENRPERILVIVEMAGGNDGLNTVVPYGHDEYYRARPNLGVPEGKLLKLDDEFGLHPAMEGFERLFKDGNLAIAHGCSYPKPSRSHFVSMDYWHTGVPNGSDSRGWLGRYADAFNTKTQQHFIVNIAKQQSLAVKSANNPAIVFSNPDQFIRRAQRGEEQALETLTQAKASDNSSLEFMRSMAEKAEDSSAFVRNACKEYRTQVSYGARGRANLGGNLTKVAALIKAGLGARIYYCSLGGFDTHANQGGETGSQALLLAQVSDGIRGFLEDMERIGRGDDVAVMVFTEFGRRVRENNSRGTDHGVATPMFICGKPARGGFYGQHPSLTDLDKGDLKMTTDFRSVYGTMIHEWMGFDRTDEILKGQFETLGVFA